LGFRRRRQRQRQRRLTRRPPRAPPARAHPPQIWSSLLGRGALSVMWLMFSGEATSPLQYTWMVTKYAAGRGSARCAAAQRVLSPLFTLAFTLARVFVGPPIALAVLRGVAHSPVLPLGARVTWCVIAVVGVFGSWLWVRKLLLGLVKARAKNRADDEAAARVKAK
jgi:hypothetical protein